MHTISVIKINSVLMQYLKKIKINTRSKVLDFSTKTRSVLLLIFFDPQLYQGMALFAASSLYTVLIFLFMMDLRRSFGFEKILHQEAILRTSLVVQWLRLCLPFPCAVTGGPCWLSHIYLTVVCICSSQALDLSPQHISPLVTISLLDN